MRRPADLRARSDQLDPPLIVSDHGEPTISTSHRTLTDGRGTWAPWPDLIRPTFVRQCGLANLAELRLHPAGLRRDLAARYLLVGYVGSELPNVFALADVVISRSGAGTIAELIALGKVSVLISLATAAGNEQAHNARHLHDASAAVAVLDDATLETLRAAVAHLLVDSGRRRAIAQQARSYGRPDAADRLVDVLLSVAADRAGRPTGDAAGRQPCRGHRGPPSTRERSCGHG